MNGSLVTNGEISQHELNILKNELAPLIGVQLELLKIPKLVLQNFEPGQIGSIAGVLLDASIPQLSALLPDDEMLAKVGIRRSVGILGDREGYPDYTHVSGKRLELKLLYVDPIDIEMKKPKTPREASARLTQKVTLNNVDPMRDALLIVPYQLRPDATDPELYSLTILDVGVFSMLRCIHARDQRLIGAGGKWFGNYDTPVVLSKQGRKKKKLGMPLDEFSYGRKEAEGKDYNEDTNFGKLARIPYAPLRQYLRMYGSKVTTSGE